MKINVSYNRIFKSIGYIIGIYLSFLLPSCSDEITANSSTGDDMEAVNVVFSITDIENIHFSTRAAVDRVNATEYENTFSNIYLIYEQLTDKDGKSVSENAFHIEDLTGKESSKTEVYKNYNLTFYPGKYCFFVVVNINNYLDDNQTVANSVTSSDQVRNLINYFNTSKTISNPHIPMGCLDTEMLRNGSKVSSGIVEISAANTNMITAPLTFLCAKVRYTILFDARPGGISENFGDNLIRFDVSNYEKPYVVKYDKEITLSPEEDVQIINAGFDDDPGEEWKGDNFTAVRVGLAEQYSKYFNTYQDLDSREPGLYKLEVQGYYRFGAHGGAYDTHFYSPQTELINSYMYISQIENNQEIKFAETPLMCMFDEPSHNDFSHNGYPFSMEEASQVFGMGLYKNNKVSFTLDKKSHLRIGIKNIRAYKDDWTIFDNFKLTYQKINITINKYEKPQTISLGKYKWPSSGVNYPKSATENLEEFEGNEKEWFTECAKAWQGMVYLSENLTTDPDVMTVMHFPYCYNEETSSEEREKTLVLFDKDNISDPQYGKADYRSGLERGMFYDVVIRVINPDEMEYTVKVYSMFEDWHNVVNSGIDEGWLNNGNSSSEDDAKSVDVDYNHWNHNSYSDIW